MVQQIQQFKLIQVNMQLCIEYSRFNHNESNFAQLQLFVNNLIISVMNASCPFSI